MKLPHTEVKFYPVEKSQTGLSSLWVSCKRALKQGFIHFSGGSIVDFEHIKAGYVKSTLV